MSVDATPRAGGRREKLQRAGVASWRDGGVIGVSRRCGERTARRRDVEALPLWCRTARPARPWSGGVLRTGVATAPGRDVALRSRPKRPRCPVMRRLLPLEVPCRAPIPTSRRGRRRLLRLDPPDAGGRTECRRRRRSPRGRGPAGTGRVVQHPPRVGARRRGRPRAGGVGDRGRRSRRRGPAGGRPALVRAQRLRRPGQPPGAPPEHARGLRRQPRPRPSRTRRAEPAAPWMG